MIIKNDIEKFFDDNNLFDNCTSFGLKITMNSSELLISGDSRDLVMLADVLVSLAMDKDKNSHIHIDNLTMIDEKSDIKEVIIEKSSHF